MKTTYRKVEIPETWETDFITWTKSKWCPTHEQILEWFKSHLRPIEPEEPETTQDDKKEEPQWHLNCTKCEKPYWDRQPFPAFQLCPECKSTKIEPKQSIKDKIKPFVSNEEPVVNKWIREDAEKKTAEEIKNKIYDKITDDLKSSRLEGLETDDGDKYPLIDFLSSGNTVKTGLSEVHNLVEQIDIDELLKEYAQQEKAIEVTDEEINAYAEKYQNYIHVRNFDRGLKQGIKHGAKWLRDKLKGV